MPPRINLPAVLPTEAEPAPPRTPLVPERSDFLEGDAPAAAKVEAFLARALEATGSDAPTTAGALVPWICDALLSNHSVKAYGRDLMDFVRHMQAQGVEPLQVTADHVKLYKRALLEAGLKPATVARRLSVLRGTYHQLAAKGLIVVGDRPGHRRSEGPRGAKELHPVFDREAGHRAPGGDPDRHLAGDPRPGPDERVLPDGVPGISGGRGLRGTPGDRWRRALPERDREAKQEAAEDLA